MTSDGGRLKRSDNYAFMLWLRAWDSKKEKPPKRKHGAENLPRWRRLSSRGCFYR